MREQSSPRTHVLLSDLTIEFALYAALTCIALLIRLSALDRAPLNADEALQAIASWNFVRGSPDGFTGSPLLFTGNALLFALFGAGDALARVLPALFGSAIVLLPAFLRRELGRSGALVASGLLALSPSLVFFSRSLNGAMVAVTCAFAALVLAWRYLADRVPGDLYLAAASFALALLAGREAWMIAFTLVLFALTVRARLVPVPPVTLPPESKNDLRRAALGFVVVFVGVSTALLVHRDGIGAAFEMFGAWLDGLRPGLLLSDPLRLLVVYEPMAVFFGLAAVIQLPFAESPGQYARDDRRTFLSMLAFWALIASVLYSIGADKDPARVVVLVVPFVVLAGWYIGAWLERAVQESQAQALLTQEAPIFFLGCVLGAFLYIVVAEFATRGRLAAVDSLPWIGELVRGGVNLSGFFVVGVILVAVMTITLSAFATLSANRAKDVGLALVLVLLAAWMIRQTAMMNLNGEPSPQEYLVTRAASPNVRDLVRDLEDISRWRANDSHTLAIVADESLGPAIEWALRDFGRSRYASRPAAAIDVQALLLPADARAPAAGWIGQAYRLEATRSADASQILLRWLLFREPGNVESMDVVLWIPAPK